MFEGHNKLELKCKESLLIIIPSEGETTLKICRESEVMIFLINTKILFRNTNSEKYIHIIYF